MLVQGDHPAGPIEVRRNVERQRVAGSLVHLSDPAKLYPHKGSVLFTTVSLYRARPFDAVRSFAGDDYEAAVIEPEAAKLLSRFDDRVAHHETIIAPD